MDALDLKFANFIHGRVKEIHVQARQYMDAGFYDVAASLLDNATQMLSIGKTCLDGDREKTLKRLEQIKK